MWIVLLLGSALAENCDVYPCKAPYVAFEPLQCINYQLNKASRVANFTLQPCEHPRYTYCPTVSSNSTCQVPPQPYYYGTSLPGEPCDFDYNCKYGICDQFICKAKHENETCNSNEECNPGLYCSGSCTLQKQKGDQCSADSECANNLGCYRANCADYFSLKPGEAVSNCKNGINLLCETGSCRLSNGEYKCTSAAKLQKGPYAACESLDDCLVEDKQLDLNWTTTCRCGYSQKGLSFCDLAPGDGPFAAYISYAAKWLGGTNVTQCNTEARLSFNCVKSYWNYEDYISFYFFYKAMMDHPLVQDNSDCAKLIYNQDYWTAAKEYAKIPNNHSDQTDWAYLILPVLSLILF